MTKRLFLLALAGVLLLPHAAAHGAPEVREIDTRAVYDGAASGDYGATEFLDEQSGQTIPVPLLYEGAHDLLALDIREHYNVVPGVNFRLVMQRGDPSAAPLTDTITFTSGGEHAITLSTQDNEVFTTDVGTISAKTPVGDGFPFALDVFVPYADLGVAPGDTLSAISVTSSAAGSDADLMPGTYKYLGVEIPPDPDSDPGAAQDYTLQGPAPLFTATTEATTLDAQELGNASFEVRFTNTLQTMEQFVTLTLKAPAGTGATIDASTMLLAPGETKTVRVAFDPKIVLPGDVRITADSDLGARTTTTVPIVGGAAADDSHVDSGDIVGGASFQQIFTTIGTFEYHCHPHPWMTGTVTVKAAPNGTSPAVHTVKIVEADDPKDYRFEPAALDVHAGDVVVWLNTGQMVHDVRGGFGGEGHVHGDHDHHDDHEEDAPGLGLLALLAALGAALLARRH